MLGENAILTSCPIGKSLAKTATEKYVVLLAPYAIIACVVPLGKYVMSLLLKAEPLIVAVNLPLLEVTFAPESGL